MCTVSIIPTPGGVRLACNRDELRTRPAALPPRVGRFGDRKAVMPVDPAGGGTWVAVNDAGVAFALLNVNRNAAPPPYIDGAEYRPMTLSRGLLIPQLLHCAVAEAVARRGEELPVGEYPAFRLVAVDGTDCFEIVWDGARRSVEQRGIDPPLLFTSSGLGDELVEPPRRQLFERLVARAPGPAAQDGFHRHRWLDRPHLSVCMSRRGARTVSYTVVDVHDDRAELRYHAAPLDEPVESVSVELSLRTPVLT